MVDDFDNATGTSSAGIANQWSALSLYQHGNAGASQDGTQRAASVDWSAAGGFLQLNAATGAGINASTEKSLEFRITLKCFANSCAVAPVPGGDVDFSIALVKDGGSLSASVALKSYAVVRRPSGSSGNLNSVLRTVRIPLSAFTGADLAHFKGVRFIFDKTPRSSIYLANVRLDTFPTGPGGPSLRETTVVTARVAAPAMPEFNRIAAIRPVAEPQAAGAGPGAMEIELQSNRRFPVGDALPELQVDGRAFILSRFADATEHGLVFTLQRPEYDSLADGQPVSVVVGGAAVWDFGTLRKP